MLVTMINVTLLFQVESWSEKSQGNMQILMLN